MNARAVVVLAGAMLATAAWAAPGERGGAYGGGTTGQAGQLNFQTADGNGDGVVSEQEARLVGIEQFERADKNSDGVLDEAEIAALETQQPGTSTDAAGNADSEAAGSGSPADAHKP